MKGTAVMGLVWACAQMHFRFLLGVRQLRGLVSSHSQLPDWNPAKAGCVSAGRPELEATGER